jgi:hypothetical protein
MRCEIVIICFELFSGIGCSIVENENAAEKSQPTQSIYDREIQDSSKNIWKQYKRVSGLDIKDTLPYPNCYIIINGNKLIYLKGGKEIYTDSIFLDNEYKAKTYRFKIHTADVLIVTGNDDELLLKRDAFEGDYEYFRKDN